MRALMRSISLLGLAGWRWLCRAAAQDSRPGIAVLPFENGGSYGKDKEDFDALRKGIAATLIYELGGILRSAWSTGKNPAAARRAGARGCRTGRCGHRGQGRQARRREVHDHGLVYRSVRRLPGRRADHQRGNRRDHESRAQRSGLHDRKDMFRMIESVGQRIMADAKLPPLPAGSAQRAADPDRGPGALQPGAALRRSGRQGEGDGVLPEGAGGLPELQRGQRGAQEGSRVLRPAQRPRFSGSTSAISSPFC